MEFDALSCPGCQQLLTVENNKDLITYICEHGCSMRNLPRNYLSIDYRANKLQLSRDFIIEDSHGFWPIHHDTLGE